MAKAKSSKKKAVVKKEKKNEVKDFVKVALAKQKQAEKDEKAVEKFMNQKKTEEKIMKKSEKLQSEIKKLESKKPANGNGNGKSLSKFQHKAACRSGRIDSLVIAGESTPDQILKTLRKEFGSCADGKVKSHIRHLAKAHGASVITNKAGIVKVTQAK